MRRSRLRFHTRLPDGNVSIAFSLSRKTIDCDQFHIVPQNLPALPSLGSETGRTVMNSLFRGIFTSNLAIQRTSREFL